MNLRAPNILLITTDQQRFDHLGLKGVGGIATPNLDRLGREGIHFDRAYTASPVCTPARVSLLTGRYPSSHGAYSIGVTADPFPFPTLPAVLAEHGYDTALFGKPHFVSRMHEAAHIAGRSDPTPEFFRNHRGPYLGFQTVAAALHHTINGVPDCHYRAWLEEQGVDYAQWFPDVNGRHDHAAVGAWNIPVPYHDSTWITNTTLEFLRERAASGRPWFCWSSYNDPHEPFVCPEPWYSSVDASKMRLLPGHRTGEFNDKPPFYEQAFQSDMPVEFRDGDRQIPVPCAFRRADLAGKERDAMQATLGMVAMLDHEVGRLLSLLESNPRLANTLVVFTTDHGEIHGHHGVWHKGLYPYEDCQRIPMLAWGPGIVKRRGTMQALVNLVDLPRTFLDLAGIGPVQGIQGESLMPLLRGEKDSVQDETLVELQATRAVYQQTFITAQHKLIVYRDQPYGELYDLAADPDQYVNLWSDPAHAALRAELLHRFVQFNMKKEGYVHPRVAFA